MPVISLTFQQHMPVCRPSKDFVCGNDAIDRCKVNAEDKASNEKMKI